MIERKTLQRETLESRSCVRGLKGRARKRHWGDRLCRPCSQPKVPGRETGTQELRSDATCGGCEGLCDL